MKRHRAGASVGSVAITVAVVAAACTAGGGGAPGTSATQPIDHPSPSTSTAPPAVGESGRALSEEAPDATAAAEATTSDHGERPSPDGVGDPVGGTGFVSVELGVDFGCALRASGEVACWGWNNAGQASPPQGRVSVLAVGSDFACGIRVGGAVECWGNTGGWPLATPDGEFIDIASGDGFACGVRAGGSVACWGDYTATASLPADTGFVSIALGPEYACAERGDGSGTCWPKGEVGFAGLDYDFDLFEIYDNFRLGSLGTERACGIGEAGDVSCWLFFGLDGFGQDSPPPGEFVAVDVTHTFTCGVRADGEVECWGAQSAVPCVGGGGLPVRPRRRRQAGVPGDPPVAGAVLAANDDR